MKKNEQERMEKVETAIANLHSSQGMGDTWQRPTSGSPAPLAAPAGDAWANYAPISLGAMTSPRAQAAKENEEFLIFSKASRPLSSRTNLTPSWTGSAPSSRPACVLG